MIFLSSSRIDQISVFLREFPLAVGVTGDVGRRDDLYLAGLFCGTGFCGRCTAVLGYLPLFEDRFGTSRARRCGFDGGWLTNAHGLSRGDVIRAAR